MIPDPWSKRGIHWLQTHLLRYLWRETPRFAALVKATAEANGLAKALRVDGQVIGMYVPACNTRGQGIRDGDKERLDGIQWKKERFLPSSHKVERAVPCEELGLLNQRLIKSINKTLNKYILKQVMNEQ